MFYFEQAIGDRWCPVKTADAPQVKNDRIQRAGSAGPRVRAVQAIPAYFAHLTLGQLREVLGPDGRFRGGAANG